MLYDKIIVPLDGTRFAEAALDKAAELAKTFNCSVTLVGVVESAAAAIEDYPEFFPPMDLTEKMEDFLNSSLEAGAKRLRSEGIPTEVCLRTGSAGEEISSLCMESGADLVIMTSHGRKGFWHFLLGSVSEKVARKVACDVLVIHRWSGGE